jgi:quercetin dioxygenase-like cupin family protein
MTIDVSPIHSFGIENISFYVYHANKNEGIGKHNHDYNHITICHNGAIKVIKEDFEKILTKNDNGVNLKAGEWHEIKAIEDNTVFVNISPITYKNK